MSSNETIADLQARLATAEAQATALSEVMAIINGSPGNLAPVFDAMLDKAMALCGVDFGLLRRVDGEHLRVLATRGVPAAYAEYLAAGPFLPTPGGRLADVLATGRTLMRTDMRNSEPYRAGNEQVRAIADLGGARTLLSVPLMKDGVALGVFTFYRQEVRAFSNQEITLLESFAAQAVIAMENARLLTEQREALERQTATAEVLQVINASPGNLVPVFDAMLEKAMRLCGVAFGLLRDYDGEQMRTLAIRGVPPAYAEYMAQNLTRPLATPDGAVAQALTSGRAVQRLDIREFRGYLDGTPTVRALADLGGARSSLNVPLVKDGISVGLFTVYRKEVSGFTEQQVSVLENFAAQAAIAMENARLLTEQQEALERQTATAALLEVINANPGNLGPVFDSILEMAHRLCGAERGSLQLRDGDWIRAVATRGFPAEVANVLRRGQPIANAAGLHMDQVNQIEDQRPLLAARPDSEMLRATVDVAGTRTALAIPLLKDGVFLGRIMAGRTEVRRFTDKQIGLLENFAAQAVIAIENARLLGEIRTARDNAETSLHDLKVAQANLVQAEKMASLGQLTAGIAHEIKNPLNFVNNFADLSVELLAELREVIAPALAGLDDDTRADADDLSQTLTSNLRKITEHGKRADGIVRGMLEHSRGASGERRAVDLNDLVEEALNLSYHGARAQDQSFNITLERDYAPGIAPITLTPQDITRVLLNLFSNGFYAAKQRAKTPTLKVTTRDLGHAVEIRVRDNGTGIPPDIRDKLFEPFFTTKPTGEGTGLGLSITYDIVTKQHGGSIAVASDVGAYTEFTVILPRTNAGVS